MLTFMLLVVLGGGLGLLAVSLAESPKPATDGGLRTRAPDVEIDPEAPLDEPDEDLVEEPPLGDELAAVAATATPGPPLSIPWRAPRDPRRVPLAYTAIEGRYDAVAVTPLWRRVLSIGALIVIAVTIGVAVAAVAAAAFGALAELLNAAVG